MDVFDVGMHTGHFDDVWPRFESAFEALAHSVEEAIPGVHVDGRAYKMVGSRFQLAIFFSKRPFSAKLVDGGEVGMVAMCGTVLVLNKQANSATGGDRTTCTMYIVEDTEKARAARLLKEGPRTEFSFDSDARILALLDQWSNATVEFIRDNDKLIIRELNKE